MHKEITSYEYKNESGNILYNFSNFVYTQTKIGQETITLSVRNEEGFIGSDTIIINTSLNGSVSPSVAIDKDRIVQINNTVFINGDIFTIAGETIKGYEWVLDGEIVKTFRDARPPFVETEHQKINFSFGVSEVRDYIIELRVWDSTGGINSNKTTIRVIKDKAPAEIYPQANAGPNLLAVVGQPINIVGSGIDIEKTDLHDTEWVTNYIDTLFGSLFLNDQFLIHFISPVMDLFQRYFFPVELEYVTDLIDRIKIRDRWNTVSTDSVQSLRIVARHSSLQPLINGPDKTFTNIAMKVKENVEDTTKNNNNRLIDDRLFLFNPDGSQAFPVVP